MPLCRVINSLCFVLCFLEPSTLLHIRNLKSCSMGCLSLIVDWYTCHLLVLQVRRLNLTCVSLTLVKCNAIQFCANMLSLIFVYRVDSFIIGCCYGITFICYCPGIILNILILLIFSFCYQLSDEPHLDGQDQDAAGEKVGVQFISSISCV